MDYRYVDELNEIVICGIICSDWVALYRPGACSSWHMRKIYRKLVTVSQP